MNNKEQYLFLVIAISIFLSALMTPIFRSLAIKLSFVDKPNQAHKTHLSPVPYLGGASIIISTFTLIIFSPTFLMISIDSNNTFLISIFFMPLILAVVGLVDDFRNISFRVRLLVQLMVSTISALVMMSQGLLGRPTGVMLFDILVTLLWLIGIPNAVNFIDNLDGGAAGITSIASFGIGFAAMMGGQIAIAYLAFALGGSVIGFLIWNLHPAKIYLGDFGSLFIGSILAIIILQLDPPSSGLGSVSSWIFGFSLMAVPILDTCCAVFSRFRRRVSLFQSGRDHLSHRLLDLGLSRKKTAIFLWTLSSFFCALGFMILLSQGLLSSLLMCTFIGLWVGLLILFFFLDLRLRKI